MSNYSLTHLSDRDLLRDLAGLVARDRSTTAALLAHVAEVDARKLYLPAAYPSMYSYCVHELRLSEDSAYKRIQAARTARQFPVIFELLANGRLHLSAVCLLAPHLTEENAPELLKAASLKPKSEIEQLIAQRFPRTEVFEMVYAVPAGSGSEGQLAPGQVEALVQNGTGAGTIQLAPGQVETAGPGARLTPVASQRFALQVTIGQGTHDKLRYAKELLGHQIPSGDMAEVLDRALDALIGQLEKRKFAATSKPRPSQRRCCAGRHVPAEVKRSVWERDGGQCTFVSDAGHRCPARTRLEFDHVDPVARGGEATAERMRLRCRAHNQYDAECTFGTAFMSHKREEAQRAAAARRARVAAEERAGAERLEEAERRAAAAAAERARAAAEQRARAAAAAAKRAKELDVVPWLRQLGFRADEARRASAHCETIPDASLAERVRLALSVLRPRHGRVEKRLGAAT